MGKHKAWFNRQSYVKENPWVYKSNRLLSPHEIQFYYIIKRIADAMKLLIFAKVRWADFLQVQCDNEELKKAAKYYTFPKHIDILLTNTRSEPVLVIELDDKSHDDKDAEYYNENKRERDEILEKICKQINLPLLRLKYDLLSNSDEATLKEDIRKQIISIINC